MTKPTIRLARDEDLNAVQTIVEKAYALYVERLGKPPGPMLDDYAAHIMAGRCHVLETDRLIEGLSVTIVSPEWFLLDNVAIDPASQGKGYGKLLVALAEDLCRGEGYTELWLYTHALMTENIPLYIHLGFQQMHRVTEKGYDRIYMMKAV